MQTNLKDIGWMCHVVPLRKKKEPAFMPPLSQIPVLGCMPEDSLPKCEPKSNFKPTDSPYIQLSKMGGRADLLCFKENEPDKGPPVPYCRCDWFYLEDNAQDEKNKAPPPEKHVFKVPFYMTHQDCKHSEEITKPITQTSPPQLPPPRKPKKCGKLPPHRPGYADYNRKVPKVHIAYAPPVHNDPVRFPKRDVTECDPTVMPKLLAHAYVADYEKYRKQWDEVANYYRNTDICKETRYRDKPRRKSLGPKGNDLTA
ncbi:unnamed protein product [Calicophoron daubneyi]|uniref:Uncharacterized protein n=1 Tax=Calicophoron daubneyi TaxID=300641 RepID=A0AAV2T318_CALDB